MKSPSSTTMYQPMHKSSCNFMSPTQSQKHYPTKDSNYIFTKNPIQTKETPPKNYHNPSKPTIAEKFNIAADELVGTTSEWPINSHINNTFAIHLDGIYQLNKYRNKIRSSSGTREARKLMQGRYHWTDRQVDSIEWELVSSSIFTQTYATRRTITKYNHQWLMSNNKAIDNQMICPYCHQTKESFDHDQFLTCIESGERKYVRIQSFKQLLA